MNLLVGTSGYSYKEWLGSFYPEKLPAAKMLGYYGQRFRTVEINNTFYRMPSESLLARWAEEVPEGFRFVLKAPRRITHERRLDPGDDAASRFVEVAATLGEKLGPLLFQLPPFFRKDLPRLEGFLGRLGKVRAAMEFRHASWFDEQVYRALRDHGAALCVADTDEGDVPLVATCPWGYLRLRRAGYGDLELAAWQKKIRSQPWSEAFVFFKHEEEGRGPQLAARFAESPVA